MQHELIIEKRIQCFITAVGKKRYSKRKLLSAAYHSDKKSVSYAEAIKKKYTRIAIGEQWGCLWDSAWFRFEGEIPPEHQGQNIIALIDIDGEGCLYHQGEPVLGITSRNSQGFPQFHKRRLPLLPEEGQKTITLYVQASANTLLGSRSDTHPSEDRYVLKEAAIAIDNKDVWDLELDLQFLSDLAKNLPQDSPRAAKIWRGLNDCSNLWQEGKGLASCRKITGNLIHKAATASSLTAWSTGHAHLDLAWLWPYAETKRKGIRTFATALALIEEYPDYRFGASQAQLFQWIKEEEPGLYKKIKKAIAEKKIECQGAMWVEPDTNLPGGESLIRQCLYGKQFFQQEFGENIRNLWLPDVFGYSAALPQILKKCGVDFFMSQKISWNETNTFPHHSFHWKGIDGSTILAHFLPACTYNGENDPKTMIKAEKNYAQKDVLSDFLNLFGVGDGGGGPSRKHIEFARRGQECEGLPKIQLAFAQTFFDTLLEKESLLPTWQGELYLELHRGTYTSQAKIKKYNRLSELALREVEFLSHIAGSYPQKEIEMLWKNTLLNQFHDVIPGSSIGKVYEDAHALAENSLKKLKKLTQKALHTLFGPQGDTGYVVVNTLSWKRNEVIQIPASPQEIIVDAQGERIPCIRGKDTVKALIQVPSLGYVVIKKENNTPETINAVQFSETTLSNEHLIVRLGKDGTITEIMDKKTKNNALRGRAGVFKLWEDLPHAWDAWDVNHYYRETKAEEALLLHRELIGDALSGGIKQTFRIGNSTIEETIMLHSASPIVHIACVVDWKEERKMLRVEAETSIETLEASFEIQFGIVKRPTHRNTSWEEAQFETCGHRFVDLSRPDFGIALLNDSKYGHFVREGILDLNLLRSPQYPDPHADIGRHEFSFGYYPHEGSLENSDVPQRAHEFNAPLLLRSLEKLPLENEKSYYSLDHSGVHIEVVKKQESGNDSILRLYETVGRKVETRLTTTPFKKAVECNMLEEEWTNLVTEGGNSIKLTFSPFEIKTILLEREKTEQRKEGAQ